MLTERKRASVWFKDEKGPNLEDIGSLNEAHEGEEATIGPAVNGNTAQVHKFKLLRYKLQPLHLVFDLHLTLKRQVFEGYPTCSCLYGIQMVFFD